MQADQKYYICGFSHTERHTIHQHVAFTDLGYCFSHVKINSFTGN